MVERVAVVVLVDVADVRPVGVPTQQLKPLEAQIGK
jgi:hypothetical protein